MRILDASTLRDWLETHYCAQLPAATRTIIIGRTHSGLDSDLDHRRWYLITPYNPGGRQLGEAENRKRLAEMNMRLNKMNSSLHPAENRDPAGRWPVEAGFLITGLERNNVIKIAREFEQDGIVAGSPGAPAELWLIRADLPDPLPAHIRRMHA